MERKNHLLFFLVAFFTLALTACGGGDGGGGSTSTTDGTGTTTLPQKKTVSGTLVEPEGKQGTVNKALKRLAARRSAMKMAAKTCPGVPDGYKPLRNVSVQFFDANGAQKQTATTDDCGYFKADVPVDVVQVKAESPDNDPIVVDVGVFESGGGKVASAIPLAAAYQIASIQKIGVNLLAVTVTDSVTNKAVIGIPKSAFTLELNSDAVDITQMRSAANAAQAASVVLVLDASGSMDEPVRDANGNIILDPNGIEYNRMRMTALAAHTYLDGVFSTDETAVIIFDTNVDLITDQTIGEKFRLQDQNGNPVDYTFSGSGFTSNASSLRFVIDSYNLYSTLWDAGNADATHADTPAYTQIGLYPWGGDTAVYDAISEAVSRVTARSNPRKLVVAMSDGGDNSSKLTRQEVIDAARNAGVPVYTIAYGNSVGSNNYANEAAMKEIAEGTNASFYSVKSTDITAAFQGIQTAISFQYLVTLDKPLNDGDQIDLRLSYGGKDISRQLTLQ